MGHYKSNVRDQVFNLFEVYGVDTVLGTEAYADFDAETATEMLAEMARLAEGPVAESFEEGDRNPPVFDPKTHTVTLPEAFKKYLGAGKKGDVKSLWPTVDKAVEWIRAAGGVAVVAHPLHYKMTNMKRRALLKAFKEAGGEAMEVVSGAQQSRDQTHYMAQLAKEYDLAASAGSDFHFLTQWQKPGKVNHLPETVNPVWMLWQDEAAVKPSPE